jgi:hypothetical protein
VTAQRWLFSPAVDVAAFAGSVAVSFGFIILARRFGVGAETPPWAWLVFVLGIDVAHVWSTLFRVYLDGEEVRRRPLLYAGAPVLAWGLGVAAHAASAELFWRCLAYVAVWHFVRQQVGWMTLYGRRARHDERTVLFDQVAVYAATLGPVAWWHANLPRPFWWFREGDFIGGLPGILGNVALGVHALVLGAWLARMATLRQWHAGKLLLMAATWLAWFGGIVVARSDLAFTVTNVVLHGVPYLVLLYRYARARDAEGGYGRWSVLLRAGVPGFLAVLWALAFLEEFAWDRLVWHDHPMFFGESHFHLEGAALALLVPLLSVPQTTHYLLDGFIWRTKDDAELPRRLGWAGSP